MKIGISIGNVAAEEIEELGLPSDIVNEATELITKVLIGMGSTMVFGHDWRNDGVMMRIAEFARNDRLINDRGGDPAIINRVPAENSTEPSSTLPAGLIDVQTVGGGMAGLRTKLTELCDARICLGGKMTGFQGSIPGIMEEAWLAAKDGQPVLISGCIGGAARWMTERLLERTPDRKPDYKPAKQEDLPATAEDLIKDLKANFESLPDEIHALHKRLWQTTTLDAARAVIVEILDRSD